jgi:hypothetical protein
MPLTCTLCNKEYNSDTQSPVCPHREYEDIQRIRRNLLSDNRTDRNMKWFILGSMLIGALIGAGLVIAWVLWMSRGLDF